MTYFCRNKTLALDLPPELDVPERGKDSLEKDAQTQREQTALSALYMSEAQIPGCPGEISTTIPDEEVDREVRMMLTGPDIDAVLKIDSWRNFGLAHSVRSVWVGVSCNRFSTGRTSALMAGADSPQCGYLEQTD